jgi:hypothetical protein
MHVRPLNGHDISQLGPVSLSPPHWHRHHSPPAENTESYISSCNHQQHQKDSFFTLQPFLLSAVFLPTGAHTCTPVHYTGEHLCVPVHCTCAHQCAPVCFIGVPLCAHVHHIDVHMCAPVKPIGAYWCAPVQLIGVPLGHALNSSSCSPMHVYSVYRCALMHTSHRVARAWGVPLPLNTPVWPPVQTLPKN